MRARRTIITVLIFGVLGSAIAQTGYPGSVEELLCSNRFGQTDFPGNFGFHCPPEYSRPEVNRLERFLREKCEENGSELSYDSAKDGLTFFSNCLWSVVDTPRLEPDFAIAQSKGQLRAVSEKYCLRAPVLKECVKYATRRFSSCLKQPDERKTAEIIYNIASSFLEFICHNDGDRIAEFVNAGGKECLISQQNGLLICAKEVFGNYLPAVSSVGVSSSGLGRLAKPLIPSSDDCANLDEFQDCAVKRLDRCQDGTLSNLLNSTFDSIRNELTCQDLPEAEEPQSTEISTFHTTPEYSVREAQRLSSGLMEFVKDKCERNGGPAAYKAALEAPRSIINCVESLANVSQLEARVAKGGSSGRPDAPFAAYCRKVPILKSCIKRATYSARNCFEPEEQEGIDVFHNVTSSLLRFVCRRRGNRLATFVSSGGTQCVHSKKEALLDCAEEIFTSVPAAGIFAPKLGPITARDCTDLKTFQRCAVKVFKQCDDRTPANVVEALMKYLYKIMHCKDLLRA